MTYIKKIIFLLLLLLLLIYYYLLFIDQFISSNFISYGVDRCCGSRIVAESLNSQVAVESQLGYELYSSSLADILSSPTLKTPMTVGLFAKWGSGKSFMLNKLKGKDFSSSP